MDKLQSIIEKELWNFVRELKKVYTEKSTNRDIYVTKLLEEAARQGSKNAKKSFF